MLKTLYVLVDRFKESQKRRHQGMIIDMVWPQVLIGLVESSAWTRESLQADSELGKFENSSCSTWIM